MAALPQALDDIGSSVRIVLDNKNAHLALLNDSRLQISSKCGRCASQPLPGYQTVYFGKSPPTPALLSSATLLLGSPFSMENLHDAPPLPRLLPSRVGAVRTAYHRRRLHRPETGWKRRGSRSAKLARSHLELALAQSQLRNWRRRGRQRSSLPLRYQEWQSDLRSWSRRDIRQGFAKHQEGQHPD